MRLAYLPQYHTIRPNFHGSRKLPPTLSFEEAAASVIGFGTSWHMAVTLGQVQADKIVLINAAAGGVGISAVQLAKIEGARVIAAVGSDEKKKFIQQFEPEVVINYQKEYLKDVVEVKFGKRVKNQECTTI